jgi:hypothetical protein
MEAPVPDSATALADALDASVLLKVLAQVKDGDFSARMPLEWTGVSGKVADGLNDNIIADQALEVELARVDVVTKPIDTDELLDVFRTWLPPTGRSVR